MTSPSDRSSPGPGAFQEFEELLLERRQLLSSDVKGLENEAWSKEGSSVDGTSQPTHPAELATDNSAQDLSLGRLAAEHEEISEVNEALDRIRDGTFGLCEDCQKKIPDERLHAIPYARVCILCKTKQEEGAQ